MLNKSLYCFYRPSQLDDVVGQRSTIATLKQASLANNFSHAYLFSGERGTGKTTTARILASLMTCENVKDGKVCGQCRACKVIRSGVAMDVIEIDGATNRGIDNIKALKDASQWSPQELKKKIYLIDEVHMLTKEAVSALLKIIEEPPTYLAFILCTTEANKIIGTILSRCQKFNFTKITVKDIVTRLSYIAKSEQINIEESALTLIAKIARGSMRDAIGYLEQIGTVAGSKNINAGHIQKYFGVMDRLGVINMVNAIVEGNVSLLLDQVNDMIMASVECKQILIEISEVFRNAMIFKAQNSAKLLDLPDTEVQEIKKIGEALDLKQLLALSSSFADIDKKIGFNINERWVTEASLINCITTLRTHNA